MQRLYFNLVVLMLSDHHIPIRTHSPVWGYGPTHEFSFKYSDDFMWCMSICVILSCKFTPMSHILNDKSILFGLNYTDFPVVLVFWLGIHKLFIRIQCPCVWGTCNFAVTFVIAHARIWHWVILTFETSLLKLNVFQENAFDNIVCNGCGCLLIMYASCARYNQEHKIHRVAGLKVFMSRHIRFKVQFLRSFILSSS